MKVTCTRLKKLPGLACLLGAWLVGGSAAAQSVPFSIVGHIQTFTLATPGTVTSAATITVNGVNVLIPANTVVVMPAAYMTPQQLFDCKPPQLTTPCPVAAATVKSGLALDDRINLTDPPLAAFEVAMEGNIVGGVHIAGLVRISQQSLNNSAGYIRNIDYALGEMCVGASPAPVAACAPPDTRVRINDPTKTYGANNSSPDIRFSVDPDNPTIHAQTGYPMCLPAVAPPASDPNCPIGNRPPAGSGALKTFVMSGPDIPSSALPPGQAPIVSCKDSSPSCDANQQAPFVVGDFINFQGTLFNDGSATHPYYISAHTIEANVGIYTPSGVGNTAYIFQEKLLLGTFGPLAGTRCVAILECTARIRIVGFTTDPTRIFQSGAGVGIGVYAIDVDGAGVRRTRKLTSLQQKPQAPFGRFRFELAKAPALLPSGLGATREIMVRIDDPAPLVDGTIMPDKFNSPGLLKAHGLIAGQYFAPVGEYIFPEGLVMGAPPPPANFHCLAFLTRGWKPDPDPASTLIVGQLAPWPDAVTPSASAAGVRCDN